jgi:hypothetical protein
MSEREAKPRGPIGLLADLVRGKPVPPEFVLLIAVAIPLVLLVMFLWILLVFFPAI